MKSCHDEETDTIGPRPEQDETLMGDDETNDFRSIADATPDGQC